MNPTPSPSARAYISLPRIRRSNGALFHRCCVERTSSLFRDESSVSIPFSARSCSRSSNTHTNWSTTTSSMRWEVRRTERRFLEWRNTPTPSRQGDRCQQQRCAKHYHPSRQEAARLSLLAEEPQASKQRRRWLALILISRCAWSRESLWLSSWARAWLALSGVHCSSWESISSIRPV